VGGCSKLKHDDIGRVLLPALDLSRADHDNVCYRRRMFEHRELRLRLAFVTLAGLSLVVTPFESKFRRANKTCEVSPQLDMLLPSLLNLRHIVAFTVLAVLASLSFRRRPTPTAWLLVVVLSASIEFEQLYFTDGHCRVRDLLPNMVAATLGVSIAHGIRVLHQRRSQHRPGRS
jgi:VanZ family protein